MSLPLPSRFHTARLGLALGLPLLLWLGYVWLVLAQIQQMAEVEARMNGHVRARVDATRQIETGIDALARVTMEHISAPIAFPEVGGAVDRPTDPLAPGSPASRPAAPDTRQTQANRQIDDALNLLTQNDAAMNEASGASNARRMLGLQAESNALAALQIQRNAHEESVARVERLVQERLHPEAALLFISETLPTLHALKASIQDLGVQQRRNVERDSLAVARDRLLYVGLGLAVLTAVWSGGLLWRLRQGVRWNAEASAHLWQEPPRHEVGTEVQAASQKKLSDAAQLQAQIQAREELEQQVRRELRLELRREIEHDVREKLTHESAQSQISHAPRTAAAAPLSAPLPNAPSAVRADAHRPTDHEEHAMAQARVQARKQAQTLADHMTEAATRSSIVFTQVVDAMHGINDGSKKIGEIIAVIDNIAFQTNILALNAAVEAARAGEQGRGFAVVATEVRALAGRSAEAARQIKQLIEASAGQVSQGNQLVEQAGRAMREVAAQVQAVAQSMARDAGTGPAA